jgi:hypothetical protein
MMCGVSRELMSRGEDKSQKREERPREVLKVIEVRSMRIPGEVGTEGRPRVREVIKQVPQYELIDLYDPSEDIQFQGEIAKYKGCIKPSFMSRWLQVTDTALRYYKGRCNAITCCNKPLMALPVAAIEKVELVQHSLPYNKKDATQANYMQHQLEIFLKEDFLDLYIRPDYDQRVA